jgi:hypothetical protein
MLTVSIKKAVTLISVVMGAVSTSETQVAMYLTARRSVSEDGYLQIVMSAYLIFSIRLPGNETSFRQITPYLAFQELHIGCGAASVHKPPISTTQSHFLVIKTVTVHYFKSP